MGCTNRSSKGSGISFYRFPVDEQRRLLWVAAVSRKDRQPTEHSWLCSSHFIGHKKSDDPLSPDYVPSVFKYVKRPVKRKWKQDLEVYTRRKLAKTARLEAARRETAISLLQMSNVTVDVHEPDSNKGTQTEQWCIDASIQTEVSIELRSERGREQTFEG